VGAVQLEGLRRRDAAILIVLVMLSKDRPPRRRGHRLRRALQRWYFLRRWGVRKALMRLEERGLIEPGWVEPRWVAPRPIKAKVTPEGVRVARAAAVTLELEGDGLLE